MKRTLVYAVISALFILKTSVSEAQKVGHLNFQNLIQAMPEYKTASDEYELYKQSLEDELRAIEAEAISINKKYEAETKKPAPNQTRMKIWAQQIQDMQMDYQERSQSIQDSLTVKMNELVAPIRKKIEDAVAAIAKEKGYSHVIDSSLGYLIYADEAHNIEADVRARLNIQEKPMSNPGAGVPGTMPGAGSR